MARTLVTAIDPTIAGANLTYANADQANGNEVLFDRDLMVNAKNSNAATRDITLQSNGTKVNGIAIPDVTVTIPANTGNILIDDIPREFFVQSDGKLQIDWSADTGVTFAVIKK
mgnify:FL=1